MSSDDLKEIEKGNTSLNEKKRAKQKIVFIVAAVIFLIGFNLLKSDGDDDRTSKEIEFVGEDIEILGDGDDDSDIAKNIFNSKAVPKITDNTNRLDKIEKSLKTKDEYIKKLEKRLQEKDVTSNQDFQSPPFKNPYFQNSINGMKSTEVGINPKEVEKTQTVQKTYQVWDEKPTPLQVQKKNIDTVEESNTSSEGVAESGDDDSEEFEHIIPSGSIALVWLEHGVFAGTLNNGTGGMPPIQGTIVTEFFLPMGKTYDFKGAVLTLEAKGSLSSERAFLNTVRVSGYIDDDLIDIPLEGYTTDVRAGLSGLTGEVVSKQNDLFLASLFAYTAQGLADGTVTSSQTVSTTSEGSLITNNPANVFKNSVLSGAGKGAKAVGDKVLEIAELIEAMIQVKGGQYVIVHLVQPLKLQKQVVFSQQRVKQIKSEDLSMNGIKDRVSSLNTLNRGNL